MGGGGGEGGREGGRQYLGFCCKHMVGSQKLSLMQKDIALGRTRGTKKN